MALAEHHGTGAFSRKDGFVARAILLDRTNRSESAAMSKEEGYRFLRPKYCYLLAQTLRLFTCGFHMFLVGKDAKHGKSINLFEAKWRQTKVS